MVFYTIFIVYILSGSLLDISTLAEPLKGMNITSVKEGKYSFVVSIARKNDQLREEELHICTGVLISKDFVLTAAHCLNEYSLCEIQILLGSVDLRKSKKYDPSMWITYDQWAESKNITKQSDVNDIAMIKLSEAVRKIIAEPASLSITRKISDIYSTHFVVVGWGTTNESPENSSRYLQEVRVKVLPNADCKNMLYDHLRMKVFIADVYLCSKGEPYLATGDSGGPVLSKNSVVAISNGVCPRSSVCDLPEEVVNDHRFNFHTKVYFYEQFIDDVLNY